MHDDSFISGNDNRSRLQSNDMIDGTALIRRLIEELPIDGAISASSLYVYDPRHPSGLPIWVYLRAGDVLENEVEPSALTIVDDSSVR